MQIQDRYIIQKCLDGETEAFGFIVDRYKQSVYAFAYSKLRNRQDAEDVTQKVFIKAYQKLRTLKRWDNMHAWLYSITANMCKDWIKVQSRRPDRSFIEDQDPKKLESLSTDSQDNDPMIELLNEALESLPEIYRQVLILYYLGDRDSKEIANFLGISPTSVRQRLARARDLLKDEMVVMMSKTFETQKLPVGFTFRIVEAVKHIKIDPMSIGKGVPWGLSLATGIIVIVLGLNPCLPWFSQVGTYARSVLPSETKVLKTGEIPVDIVKTSNMPFLSGNMGKGNGGEPKHPNMQNAFFLAPKGKSGTWTKKADMPTPRGYEATCVVDNIIYAIGGLLGPIYMPTSVVETYNPMTDTWTKKANMPVVIGPGAACAVDGIIYTFGGWDLDFFVQSAVFSYDPKTDTWTRKTDMPTARWVGSACVVDNIIYVIGGVIKGGFAYTSAVEAYDPKTDTWTKKTDIPIPLGCVTACTVDGIIYAFSGGWNGTPPHQLKLLFAYDPKTDMWTRKADMPEPSTWTTACAVNGIVYAIGGWGDISNRGNTVKAYNPATDTWTKKADMSTARDAPGVCAVNGKIYAIGGKSYASRVYATDPYEVATVEEYDTEYDMVTAVSSKSMGQY